MWRMSFPGPCSGCGLPSRVRFRRRRAVRLKAVGQTRELDAAVTQAGSSRLLDQLLQERFGLDSAGLTEAPGVYAGAVSDILARTARQLSTAYSCCSRTLITLQFIERACAGT